MKERTKPMKTTGTVHNFSGKVFCLECGHYMRKKNSSKHEYLVCSNYRDGYFECINKSSIRYDVLENIVLNAINEKIKKFYDEEVLRKEEQKQKNNKFKSKIEALESQKQNVENQIAKTRNYLRKIYEDRTDGLVTDKQFKDLIEEYNKNENMYNEQIKSINNDLSLYQRKEDVLKDYKEIFSKYQILEELNRVIIEEFIEKIYIGKLNEETNTRDIQIKWNFE